MTKIVFLGGGGHAKVLVDLIRIIGKYEITGILDSGLKNGNMVADIPVLGGDDLLPGLYAEGITSACIGVGSIKDNSKRAKLYKAVKEIGYSVPSLIHPQAVVSESDVKISDGVQVMAGAIIQTGSVFGENTIINSGVIVEHDCNIGKNVHICPGTVISGGCMIGDNSFIGAGATIIQGVKTGKNAVVAAGTIVLEDVSDNSMVKGVTAR